MASRAAGDLIIFAIRTRRIPFFRSRPSGVLTAAMFVLVYLVLVEITKAVFYAEPVRPAGLPHRTRGREHRIHRRAARFSHHGPLRRPGGLISA